MGSLASQSNKIVVHFDGNNNDPDDIAAVPVAAMLINSAGLQDKTTFFYDNNLGEKNEDFQVDKMRNSAEYAEKLGIDTVDYQANINAATDKLVDIFNSGEKVLSIEGGPMEAVYRALEQTEPENRQNITLLSHSWWNENRDVITRDGVDEARTWSDLKEDFPDVTFIDIDDQNDGFYNDDWNWLDNKSDPVYQEARDLMIDSNKRNDPSDAGMVFYALTGNEHSDPYDAKAFLEANPPQFEDNQSPSNPEPPKEPTETNNDYDIELDVNLSSSGNSQLTGELSFTNNGDSFEGWTIEFDAGYEIDKIWNAEIISHSGNSYVIGDVESNDYVYDGEVTDWGFTASIDDSDWVEPTNYEFNGDKLDVGAIDTNTNFPETSTNTFNSSYFIEAEDMSLSEYRIESNNFASGGKVISLYSGDGNNNDSGAASFEFSGGTGYYNIIIDTFDENDGVAQIALEQNGSELDSFRLDKQLGSNIADNKTDVSLEIKDVFVSSGDEFRIEGIEQGNEWTADHGRVDAVQFMPIEDN